MRNKNAEVLTSIGIKPRSSFPTVFAPSYRVEVTADLRSYRESLPQCTPHTYQLTSSCNFHVIYTAGFQVAVAGLISLEVGLDVSTDRTSETSYSEREGCGRMRSM